MKRRFRVDCERDIAGSVETVPFDSPFLRTSSHRHCHLSILISCRGPNFEHHRIAASTSILMNGAAISRWTQPTTMFRRIDVRPFNDSTIERCSARPCAATIIRRPTSLSRTTSARRWPRFIESAARPRTVHRVLLIKPIRCEDVPAVVGGASTVSVPRQVCWTHRRGMEIAVLESTASLVLLTTSGSGVPTTLGGAAPVPPVTVKLPTGSSTTCPRVSSVWTCTV